MDGALGSSRDGPADRSGGGGNYYGGGGGGVRHRSGGRGRGGGGRHSNNNRRHQPYGGRDNRDRPPSRGRGPRPPGNRFQTTSTTSVNQESAMEKQLSAMVSRVGELKAAPEEYVGKRPVVQVMSKNIGDLVAVFTNPGNAALFLKYQSLVKHDVDMSMEGEDTPQQIKPIDQAGSLVHLVISCVCTLPLQTGCYAAITMAVEEKAPDEFKGFAARCLTYASLYLARDFDTMLLETDADVSMCMNRLQHMLKYFAMLSKLGVVCPYDQSEDPTGTSELTMAAFLMTLVAASVKMAHRNQSVAALLAHLVLSTVPYVTDCIPHHFVMTHLLEPLEQQVLGSFVYKSSFSPGVGKSALLLNAEQQEDNDDEDDDADDKDEEDASAQCCDTLQDALRSVKKLVAEGAATTRFALLTDAPWDGLVKQSTIKSEEDTDFSSDEPLVYSSEPLRLSLTAASILAIVNDIGVDLQCFHVEGVIFGRLPIFGSSAEEDDEDEMETAANESLQAYQKGYGLLDRFFLSDAIRDVLMSHQSSVSDTGLDRGTAKNAAEQCWAVCHIMLPLVDGEDDSKGIEYPIVEVILSLILQSTESGTLRHIYLCRVLVELIRLKPDIMPQALAIGVSNLVQFYLPSLVPLARDNFSRWFSYHMTNLDYQWPHAFWEQWGAYVGKRSSRSDFITRALTLMAANVSSPSLLVKDCLPAGSRLVTCLLGTSEDEGAAGVFASLGLEIRDRIWEKNEDPDQLRAYILSDEVSETIAGGLNLDDSDSDSGSFWWRTNALIHGLLHSAERRQAQTKEAIESACSDRVDVIEVDDGNEDVYGATMDSIIRYKNVMIAVLAKDAEAYDERLNLQGEARPTEMELLESTQVYLLQQVQIILPNSRIIMEGCINCFVENQLVNVRSILRFLLDGKTKLVERWWEIASAVMRLELDKAVTNVDDGLGTLWVLDVGNDDVDSATSKRATPLIAFMESFIELVVCLVCDLLLSKQGGDLSKKLTPDEVDLVEGLKLVLLSSVSTLLNKLKATGDEGVKGVSESKGRALIEDSNIAKAKLASLCRNKGSTPALDALAGILEAM